MRLRRVATHRRLFGVGDEVDEHNWSHAKANAIRVHVMPLMRDHDMHRLLSSAGTHGKLPTWPRAQARLGVEDTIH